MKNVLITVLIVAEGLILSSCGSKVAEENKRLQAENDSLKNEIALNKFWFDEDKADQDPKFFQQIEDCNEASTGLAPISGECLHKGIENFQKNAAQEIVIPSSWIFEKAQLKLMLRSIFNFQLADGIAAYPMRVELQDETGKLKNYLKIALVPYFKENAINAHANDLNKINAYNFSKMCPPSSTCITNAKLFGADGNEYTYGTKQK